MGNVQSMKPVHICLYRFYILFIFSACTRLNQLYDMESSSLTQAWVVTRSVPTTFRTHWDEWWVTPGLPRTSSGLILKIYRALARRNENTCKTRVSGVLLFSMRRSRGTGVQTTPPPPPENHKTTKPTFNAGAHWSASEAPFKWRFAFCGIWILSTHQLKKTLSELVLQCLGQFERSKVPCAEFLCFPLSASTQ